MMKEEQQPWKATFYSELSKVELHVHLNGLIGSNSMKKLITKKPDLKIHDQITVIDKRKKRTLEECFQIFQIIHQLTTSPEDMLMVTKDVSKEFSDDGVKYLELRNITRRENYKLSKQDDLDTDGSYFISSLVATLGLDSAFSKKQNKIAKGRVWPHLINDLPSVPCSHGSFMNQQNLLYDARGGMG
ncbi:unnamed protein product [Nyctereutes procyonoides]|uniref:(raccoon dog) hypothetical protein n=1 Tax=Nyctereutes procyonoides TaxID=34880 RepID=A0A811YE18_NYCPR|nr:unnamed protein product [Nyctereutes procyonoides]